MVKTDCSNMINGIITDFIHIDDRAIHYGDGLFETILHGDNKLYFWKQHYQRLHASALRLNINCPDETLLLDDIRRLLNAENIANKRHCVIKIILSRGAGERGYGYSDKLRTNRFVLHSSLDTNNSSICTEQLLSGDLFLCKNQVSINESLAGIKHLNRLENVLARNEWNNKENKQYIDGLMLDVNQLAIECTMSNIFAVNDEQLLTPELGQSGVNGIMRQQVINSAAERDVKVTECNIHIDELLTMDELFITNSLIGLKSINTLGNKQFKKSQTTQTIFENFLSDIEKHAQQI